MSSESENKTKDYIITLAKEREYIRDRLQREENSLSELILAQAKSFDSYRDLYGFVRGLSSSQEYFNLRMLKFREEFFR